MSVDTHNLVCTFGKHRGTLWTRIPPSYLVWMINTGHSRAAIAQAELDRRGMSQPSVDVSARAIDRASLRLLDLWQRTRNRDKNEGLHAWLTRMATEALDANLVARSDAETRTLRHRRALWVFQRDGACPEDRHARIGDSPCWRY